jgi:outer membrane biosynthesis protein TonB
MTEKKKKLFTIKGFGIREAFWLALLLHLVFLLLPQSFNPFALFWQERQVEAAEPVKLHFQEPPQEEAPQTEITEQPEKQEAITPEKRPEPPETEQPTVEGTTNLKSLESPPPQQMQQPQEENQPLEKQAPVKETGEEEAETIEEAEEVVDVEVETKPQPFDPLKEQRRKQVQEAARNFRNLPMSDIPVEYDNDRSSSAEEMEGVVQFDTYNWNYQPYQAKMLRKIYREWVPKLYQIGFFRMGEPGRTVISFRIEQDGSVTALLLKAGAPISSYDLAAEHAIKAKYPGLTTEFPSLPIGFPKEYLGVTIGFFVNMEVPDRE